MSGTSSDGEMVDGGFVLTRLGVPDSADSVVLLDPWRLPEGVLRWHPFHNIVRLSPSGEIRWRAELVPGETTAKRWMGIEWKPPLLWAWTYSYECELDVETGRIKQTIFTK